jgi:anti-anti-sigma factor
LTAGTPGSSIRSGAADRLQCRIQGGAQGLAMQINIQEDGNQSARVVLTGKLDIAGAEEIALPLATLSGGKSGITIDMSGVTFIASIGIRQLISASRALGRRGGSLVLLNPTAIVNEVLVTSGAGELMTITHSGSGPKG